jgi:hypothetical protein
MGWDDCDLTVGKLFRIWRWFDQHTTDGNAISVTSALLDRIAGVTGFVSAMEKVGWLTVTEYGISMSNFDRHNGHSAKARAETARRVAKHKQKQALEEEQKGNGKGNGKTVTGALPRKEKKRKEVITIPVGMAEQVVALFNEVLPELPSAVLLNAKRQKSIQGFYEWVMTSTRSDGVRRAETSEQALAWIREYFVRTRDNDFLMGRSVKTPGHENWECDLDFLLSDAGKKHVIEKTREKA